MASFRDHKVTVSQLLGVIPEALMNRLSEHTAVDHYTKVLHGRKMFYLLMYGILENDRLSQRTLEDTFNDPIFKILFGLDEKERIRHSSLSERLGRIEPGYFRQIYECVYEQFSVCYSNVEREKYNLIRVDSTIINDLSSRMLEGFRSNQTSNKCVKFSVAFDGMLPCDVGLFTTSEYASEDKALPDVIRSHVKKEADHSNIYVIDRGLQSSRTMRDFSDEQITFIVRSKENRKYIELSSFVSENTEKDLGSLTLLSDRKVYLYSNISVHSKRGKNFCREELIEEPFRLLIAADKADQTKEFWFITNDFDKTAQEITDNYKFRWDIEVFFRFLKQELNTSHLVSLNPNGIQVILYMTLIVAMLILIYKRANNVGYKTAKRRFAMEIRDLAIQMIVTLCGGDPKLFFKT
jgi:transposase